jgi:hypothetical protein
MCFWAKIYIMQNSANSSSVIVVTLKRILMIEWLLSDVDFLWCLLSIVHYWLSSAVSTVYSCLEQTSTKKLLHDKMNHNDCHLMLSLLCFKKRPAYSLHKAPRNEWIVCTAFDCTISKKIKVIQNNRSDTLYCFANSLKLKTIYKNLVNRGVVVYITFRLRMPNESLI